MTELWKALKAGAGKPSSAALTFSSAATVYVTMILLSFPTYSFQMVASKPSTIFQTVLALSYNLFNSSGFLGLSTTFLYSITAGFAITTAYKTFQNNSVDITAGTVLPGFLASGCASCGVGVLGVLGFTGALAALPFQGSSIRLAGSGLMLFYLQRVGDPEVCSIDGL